MYKPLFTFIIAFVVCFTTSYSQALNRVSLEDYLSIDFPCMPEKKNMGAEKQDMYWCKSNGCGYMVGIVPSLFKDYDQYLKFPREKQTKFEDTIIERFIKRKLSTRNKNLISRKPYRLGENAGCSIVYSEPDPIATENPKPRLRFATIIVIKNMLYTIECWYLDDKLHDLEREHYFKSILLKD